MEEEQSLVWETIGQQEMHYFRFRESPILGEAAHEEAQCDRDHLLLFEWVGFHLLVKWHICILGYLRERLSFKCNKLLE